MNRDRSSCIFRCIAVVAAAATIGIVATDAPAQINLNSLTRQVQEQVRGQADDRARPAQGGGATHPAAAATVRADPNTQRIFDKWVSNLNQDTEILAGKRSVEQKIDELEGGKAWFFQNHAELVKHPNYEQGLTRMTELMFGLAEQKSIRAVEFARKGLQDMNPNLFIENSGTYQQLREAEKLLTDFGKGSPAGAAGDAVEQAKSEVARLSAEYSRKSAADYRLPADAYRGGDKAELSQKIAEAWKANYPGDQILGIRFPRSDFERRKEVTYNNGWIFYDNSVLLANVVIRKSGELATVYPAYVNRNHQSGAMSIGARTKGPTYSHQDMLLKNVKF